ncbi:unnamed protein product [Effrenium voratum]|uniref:Uncharacterized protein n=1 Tax=Effrenium voratum TaxID=2562239 RepID=A0AA36J0W2_9DINO|nr:unnamed protein product [Effrenium voratum]CAJ1458113.1 unnamed protein product [Effrenium voratum]
MAARKKDMPRRKGRKVAVMAEKATRKLTRACLQLCEALAKATAAQRHRVIAGLSQGLRKELISIREAQQNVESARTRSAKRRSQSGRLPFRVRGNVWCVRTAAGCYHRVRLTVSGVAVTSVRLTRTHAQHGLATLRLAAESAAPKGAEAILRAVDAAGASFPVCQGGLGLSYQAVLDARSAVGRRLHSPAVSVEEAILLQRQVADKAARGPLEMGRAWCGWAQELRHRKGRCWRWSQQQAESIFAEVKQDLEARALTERRGSRLETCAQSAEDALQQVLAVSDAVSIAQRRWLSLSEPAAERLLQQKALACR